MRRITSSLIVTLTACVLQHVPAHAQFRNDQPPVLAPTVEPQADPAAETIRSFQQRYAAAKKPRIALFWNRQLTDSIASRVYQRSSTNTMKSESTRASGGEEGGKNADKEERTSATTINSQETADDQQEETLDPRYDGIVKAAFIDSMGQGGVRFVERNLMVRATAAQVGGAVDPQLNEMRALQSKAQWLLEINLVRDEHAPLGHSFRVKLQDLQSGTLLTEFLTTAIPTRRESSGYVAVNGGAGFVRAPPPPPATVSEIGFNLGVETMAQLNSVL